MKSKKLFNQVLSTFLCFALSISSISMIQPIKVKAAEYPNVKIYAEKTQKEIENSGVKLEKVVDHANLNYSIESWHYSGNYWNLDKYDSSYNRTEGGVGDIVQIYGDKEETMTYWIANDSDLANAINEGKNVYVNISSANENVTLNTLFKAEIDPDKKDSKGNMTILKSNADGTLLPSDFKTELVKVNGQYEIRITFTPILNVYSDDQLSYKGTYGIGVTKWIPFVKNGYGYQIYSMYGNGWTAGYAKGWVNANDPKSLEGMPEGYIHPSMIYVSGSDGRLKDGYNIGIANNNHRDDIKMNPSAAVRIGDGTFKQAGAVGLHFDFPVVLDIYVEGDNNPYTNGKVVTSYVKFAGVNLDGTPRYEQIKTEVEPAELNEAGKVEVEDIKEIEEGTAYLNDVLTSPKDLTGGTDSADKVNWEDNLPESDVQKINGTAEDIWSFNLSKRMGILEYPEMVTLLDSEEYSDIIELKARVDADYEAVRTAPTQVEKQVAQVKLNTSFSNLLTYTGDIAISSDIDVPLLKKIQADKIAVNAFQEANTIVAESEFIEDTTEVQLYDANNRDEVKTGVINDTPEEKTTLYLRYIVQPERKVRHFIRVYKNGKLISTEVQTDPLPVIETDDGFEPYVDIPVIEDAEFIQWESSKDLPLPSDMPPTPIKKGTTQDPVNLDTDENLFVEWKRELFTSTEVPDQALLVEQWRLSKFSESLGYQSKAYMNLNLRVDGSSCISSTLSPNGNYSYKTINPNGKYTDNNYNPSNYNYSNYLHSKALTRGSYKVTHNNPSVLVDVTGNINLIKGTDTFGIKAASWLTDSGTVSGLSAHSIATAVKGEQYSGSDTVKKSDTLKYGIENNSTYTHQYTVYNHVRHYHSNGGYCIRCKCYRLSETRAPKSSSVIYETADYNINSTFDRYIPKATEKLSVSSNKTVENGKTTVSYQVPYELKVYPEVPMLFDNDEGGASIKWVSGDIARTLNPVIYHTLQFKVYVDEISNAANSATDTRARQKASSMGLSGLGVAYKGSPLNTVFKIGRSESDINTAGILTAKTFALDVTTNKNGVNIKNEWGLSSYNPISYHNDFLGKWTFKGTAYENLEIQSNSVVAGGIRTQNVDLTGITYSGATTTTFTHDLIIRGGQVVGVRLQNRSNNSYSTVPIADLQAKDSALYEALVNMKLVGNKENTILKVFEHQVGHQLTEQKYLDMVNQAKLSADGFATNNLAINKGWYSEDTTVLQIKEYVNNYQVPTTAFSDKISLSIAGLETPIDKNQFFSVMAKGYTNIKYDFLSAEIGYGIGTTNVYFEHNSRTGSPFGKQKVDYLVPNVSVTDTTRVN